MVKYALIEGNVSGRSIYLCMICLSPAVSVSFCLYDPYDYLAIYSMTSINQNGTIGMHDTKELTA